MYWKNKIEFVFFGSCNFSYPCDLTLIASSPADLGLQEETFYLKNALSRTPFAVAPYTGSVTLWSHGHKLLFSNFCIWSWTTGMRADFQRPQLQPKQVKCLKWTTTLRSGQSRHWQTMVQLGHCPQWRGWVFTIRGFLLYSLKENNKEPKIWGGLRTGLVTTNYNV